MNVSDSERIAGFLSEYKIKPAKNINKADLVIFNTCGVRQSAENRVYGQIHNLTRSKEQKSKNKKIIILTGCLANRKDVQRKLKDKVDLFFPINRFDKFENWLIGNCLKIGNWKLEIPAQRNKHEGKYESDYLTIKPKYFKNHQAFVPVMTGCNNFCSYCVVPYARGRETSRSIKDIIDEIDSLVKNGCEEITLLGQNVNSYSYKNINFPRLLEKIVKNNQQIKFKFLTSHPKDFSDELIKVIAQNKNISREIHLPVQAGSDKILKLMNRPYSQKKYLDLIKKIKRTIPQATFTTDVIVGFPGETKKDFAGSAKVFKKVGYSEAYINKYSPRPGTAAFQLGDAIPQAEKKRREKVLRKIVKDGY